MLYFYSCSRLRDGDKTSPAIDLAKSSDGRRRKSCSCAPLFVRRFMSHTADMRRNNFIYEKTFLAEIRQKERLSMSAMAEFAALFCTGSKPEPYAASAVESLTVQWRGSPVQWKVGLHTCVNSFQSAWISAKLKGL